MDDKFKFEIGDEVTTRVLNDHEVKYYQSLGYVTTTDIARRMVGVKGIIADRFGKPSEIHYLVEFHGDDAYYKRVFIIEDMLVMLDDDVDDDESLTVASNDSILELFGM